jgi:hypothetical protein
MIVGKLFYTQDQSHFIRTKLELDKIDNLIKQFSESIKYYGIYFKKNI